MMASSCRICQRSKVDGLIPISRTAATQRKLISDMLSAVTCLSMEENDRLPQHICNKCFGRLDQTYSLRMLCRRSLRKFLLHAVGETEYRCLICCASNDGDDMITIDCVCERRKMKISISDMIEQLVGVELIKEPFKRYVCGSCSNKLNLAYGFKRKCLKSEMNWLKKVSYPWEKMEVDGSNPKHLVVDLYAEVVQRRDDVGKAHCSICLLVVDAQQLGKKCEGCMLEFRNYEQKQTTQASPPAEESSMYCSLEMECVSEEKYSQELNELSENERIEERFGNDDFVETNFQEDNESSEVAKPNTRLFGYVEEPEKVFDIIEEYPGDPFPTVRRKGPFCCKCFKFFATKSDLADHKSQSHQTPTGSGEFSCDICLLLHVDRPALEQHRRSLETFVYDFCKSCQRVLPSPNGLRLHKARYHMDFETARKAESNFETEIVITYDCCVPRCYNRYTSEEQLLKHCSVAHDLAGQLNENTCQYCRGTFPSEFTLLNHRRIEKERYRCQIDGCNFTRMAKSCMWLHCSQKPHLKASYAHGRMTGTKILTPDMKHFSMIGELDDNTDVLERKGKLCCRCYLIFDSNEELAAHCELHTIEDGQPFQCEVCHRGFNSKAAFAHHNRLQEIPTHYYCRACKTFLWRKVDYVNHKVADHHIDDDLSGYFETVEDHSFTCCGCWEAFETDAKLVGHRRENHPPVPSDVFTSSMKNPKCDYCHKFMGTMEKLEQHIAIYESRTSCRCKVDRCAFRTKDMDHMRRHIFYGIHRNVAGAIIAIKNTALADYRCCVYQCAFRCNDYDAMIDHGKAVHADKREQLSIFHNGSQFSCPVCCKGFSKQSTLISHKHGKKKLRCRGCQQYFRRNVYLSHVQECTASVKCEICDKVISSKRSLQNHMKAIHSDKSEVKIDLHICSICGKQVRNIRAHLLRHTNMRDWKCDTCGARFNSSSLLKNHHRTHRKERNFPCRLGCEKRYKAPGDRARHERLVHLGIKPFACEFCDDSFIRERDLRLHRRKHTGLKLFPCTCCNASFDKWREFEEHCKDCVSSIE